MHRRLFPLLLVAATAACSYVPRIPGVTPYRIDIQQGNYISQEMVGQLKPGMSKEQVRHAHRTPHHNEKLKAEPLDYVKRLERPGADREQRKLTVFFEDGRLTRLDGDLVAAGATQ